MAMTDDLSDLEWTGHVVGDIWKVNKIITIFFVFCLCILSKASK
jgi:hypothetical protein